MKMRTETTNQAPVDLNNYKILNEGLGGAYERLLYSSMLHRIAQRFGCKRILELNATHIAGIPGFNSCVLSQAGYDVTVAVKERDYADTCHVWELTGLKANIVKIDRATATSFKDKSFDMVWNHLAFDQYRDPKPLVAEMKRISKTAVVTLTLSPYNYGYWIHQLSHRMYKQEWDHGYPKLGTIAAQEKVHRELGLRVVEHGACDAPPWMDTVNAQIGESMTYMDAFPKAVRNNWVWCSADKRCQEHWMVKMFGGWEEEMPLWFKQLAAHHLYVASVKQ